MVVQVPKEKAKKPCGLEKVTQKQEKISEKDTIVTIQDQKLKQDTGLAESGRYL